MYKEQPKQFSFLYPVVNDSTKPVKVITELQVIGNVDTGRLQENLGINIIQINHAAKGERIASDIKAFLRFVNPDLYEGIVSAALNHATEKYGLKKHSLA